MNAVQTAAKAKDGRSKPIFETSCLLRDRPKVGADIELKTLEHCTASHSVTCSLHIGSIDGMGRCLSISFPDSSNYQFVFRNMHLHTFPNFHNLPIDEIYLCLSSSENIC